MELQSRTKQCDHPNRWYGSARFPMYSGAFDFGNIDDFTFDRQQLTSMKKTCQKHCFSTLNHNLAYCYSDARVIKWMWENVKRGFRGGVHSFED